MRGRAADWSCAGARSAPHDREAAPDKESGICGMQFSWPRSASLRVNGSDGCGGGDAEVCCKGAQKILKKINK